MNNRKRRAYTTALQITWRYLWLNLKSQFFGPGYKRHKLPEVHARNAQQVKTTILALQGLFVKFGQLISILANVLPEAFRAPLTSLQDKIPARSYHEVASTFFEQTGKKPEAFFDAFEQTPIAAASIGQVHLAEKNGVRYAVKIQHADIESITSSDLKILKHLLLIYSWFMDLKGADYIYEQIREMIEQELDYTKECTAMQHIAEIVQQQPELNVIVPQVNTALSGKKVLVTAFFEGKNIGDQAQLEAWGIAPKNVAERLLLLYANMILNAGYYHADPHPGNFLINASGQIALLDFGAVATLNDHLRMGIPELIEAVIKNDTEETVNALNKMGFIAQGSESKRIAEHLINIGRRFLEDEIQLDGLDFSSVKLKSGMAGVFKLLKEVNIQEISSAIQIPKNYILLYRTMMLLFGLSFHLAPKHNPIDTIRPFVQKNRLLKTPSLHQTILLAVKRQLTIAMALPDALETFLKKANHNALEIKVQNFDKGIQKIYRLGQQFLFSVLCGFSYLMADSGHGDGFFWVAGLTGLLFLRAWWLGRKA